MKRFIPLLVFMCLLFAGQVRASATDFWINQNGSGAANGTTSGNAAACDATPNTPQSTCAAANNPSNYGSGSTQIGCGTTVHFSGTIIAANAAAGYISPQASGCSGNPIILQLESGADLKAGYWGEGAIEVSGQNYITIQGTSACGWISWVETSCAATIEGTANGTSLANQQDFAWGIYITGATHIEVKYLNVINMYQHTCSYPLSNCTDTGGFDTVDVYTTNSSNILFDHNYTHDAKTCLQNDTSSGTNSDWETFNNVAYQCSWGIQMGDSSTSGAGFFISGISIHDNEVRDGWTWDEVTDTFHHDGISLYLNNPNSVNTTPLIARNYIWGDWGLTETAHIYVEGNGGSVGNINGAIVVGNLAVNSSSTSLHGPVDGMFYEFANNSEWINNTIIDNCNGGSCTGNGGSAGFQIAGDGAILKNNVNYFSTNEYYSPYPPGTTVALDASDYNNFFDFGAVANYHSNFYNTLANWQACTGAQCQTTSGGPDLHGTNTSPNLNSSSAPQPYQIASSSGGAYQTGVNLYSLGIAELNTDACGNSRPSTGAWDMGICQFVSALTSPAITSIFLFNGTP